MRSTIALVAALALLTASGACVDGGSAVAQPAEQDPVAPAPAETTAKRRDLSHTARALLRPRMLRHGDEMESLLWAVLTLDFRAAEIVSARMTTETRIRPPTDGPIRPLSVLVPPDYFTRERRLFESAARVLRAAREQKPLEMAAAYGELVGTCISCHARYWHGTPAD